MKAEELLSAIGEIDEALIAEAEEGNKKENTKKKKERTGTMRRILIGVVAAAVAIIILLPNMSVSVVHAWEKLPVLSSIVKVVVWRDYQKQEGRYEASVSVPRIEIEQEDDVEAEVNQQLAQSVDTINLTIEEMTNKIILAYEQSIQQDPNLERADSIQVDYEVITNNENYFTLKVWVAELLGSGWVREHYYTIDRSTGKIVELADLFPEQNYIESISEEIKKQMAEQMAADDSLYYWLNDQEAPDINFQAISENQSFYISEEGTLVICFNEGDVAPMYMGCVQFEMPATIWSK